MWCLSVDSAGSVLGVALAEVAGGKILKSKELVSESLDSHHEDLAGFVSKALSEMSLTADKIDRIVVNAGPGSFTGLRIGMAFAKGMSQALGVPLCALPRFPVIASAEWQAACSAGCEVVIVLSDARRAEWFSAAFSLHGSLAEVLPLGIRNQSAITEWIRDQQSSGKKVRLVHDGTFSLESALSTSCSAVSSVLIASIALAGIEWCSRHEQELRFVADLPSLANLTPAYVREVSAKTIEQRAHKQAIL